MTSSSPKIALVTGCSSGIGRQLALLLSQKDQKYIVYATMRNPSGAKGKSLANEASGLNVLDKTFFIRTLDVTKQDQLDKVIAELMDTHGRIDVVVNNAGVSLIGTHEMNSIEDSRKLFDANFFGVVSMHNAVLPIMRKQKSGHMIAVSSVGGNIGFPMNDLYCATKFALEGLYESMAAGNKACGISTSIIQPAATSSDFVENTNVPDMSTIPEELQQFAANYIAYAMEQFKSAVQSPDGVAEAILRAIEDGEAGKAHLRYPSNEVAAGYLATKYLDITGDVAINAMMDKINSVKKQ